MFELQADARFSALSTARTDLNRRLEIYQSQYRTKEAQYAELGIVRKRNLEKVLRTLERQEHLSSSRKMNLDKDYERFQSQRTAVQSTLDGTSYAHRSLQQIQKTVSPVLIVNIHNYKFKNGICFNSMFLYIQFQTHSNQSKTKEIFVF